MQEINRVQRISNPYLLRTFGNTINECTNRSEGWIHWKSTETIYYRNVYITTHTHIINISFQKQPLEPDSWRYISTLRNLKKSQYWCYSRINVRILGTMILCKISKLIIPIENHYERVDGTLLQREKYIIAVLINVLFISSI